MKTKPPMLLGLALITLFALSCKKYEEGPAFSLRTKKARVANIWKYEKVFETTTGKDFTADFADETIELKKDGTAIWYDGVFSTKGTWEFASDKENIVFTESTSSSGHNYKILRLTNNEMWLTYKTNYNFEYHFVSK